MWPAASISTTPRRNAVFGCSPAYRKTPAACSSRSSPVRSCRRPAAVTPSTPPMMLVTRVSGISSILGAAATCPLPIAMACSEVPGKTSCTRSAMFARWTASSAAESPPPATTTVLPAKNGPSQTPQYETPRPWYSSSPGIPACRTLDPTATMTVAAVTLPPRSSISSKPSSAGVSFVTLVISKSAPDSMTRPAICGPRLKPCTFSSPG